MLHYKLVYLTFDIFCEMHAWKKLSSYLLTEDIEHRSKDVDGRVRAGEEGG